MSKEITFNAEGFHCGPAGRNEVEITAYVEPASVIACFDIEEIIEDKTADSLLMHIGIEQVRKWLEANEYLTGQRPADVIIMRSDDTEGDYFLVTQGKTGLKLRILMRTEAGENSLGRLIGEITERNAHSSKYLLINKHGKRMTKGMLRLRWDKAREKAQQKAIDQGDPLLAAKIGGFQFRDIRPKAASEILDIGDASLLLGHSKQEITKRVYRRIGATAKPSK